MLHRDGTMHFSDLKRFAQSPAHYLHSVTCTRDTTRPMRIGALTDMLLLTEKEPLIWPGERRGKEYELFRSAHAGQDIYTATEYAEAEEAVLAVRANDLAMQYLTGKPQVPLRWEMNAIPCSTRGVDVIGDGWISDLKTTNTTQPDRFAWHARRSHWHAQMAFYREACRQNGIPCAELYLVGVESSAPYCSTVLKLTDRAIEEGDRCIALWLEQYKGCAAVNEWPGYVQCVQPFDIPAEDGFVLEGLDDD